MFREPINTSGSDKAKGGVSANYQEESYKTLQLQCG
jgi:hypothetical protein